MTDLPAPQPLRHPPSLRVDRHGEPGVSSRRVFRPGGGAQAFLLESRCQAATRDAQFAAILGNVNMERT